MIATTISHQNILQILNNAESGKRVHKKEALQLLQSAHWSDLVGSADRIRQRVHPRDSASYTMFRIINYTNVCSIECNFCSFHRYGDRPNSYILSHDEIYQKVEQGLEQGADQVFFQGGVNPDIPLAYYLEALQGIKKRFQVHIRAFSPVELEYLSRSEKMPLKQLLEILKESGLDSVPGAGAEILSERVRKILSPKKLTTEEWVEVMKACHRQNLPGSANIVFGSVETEEEIIDHLDLVRSIQDETGGFHSFIAWTFQPQTKKFTINKVAPHRYLQILALSRIYLDNIKNIEVSVLGLGKVLGALGLHGGANDISSPVIEENVMRSFGLKSEEEAIRFLIESGFRPLRRDFNYDPVKMHEMK